MPINSPITVKIIQTGADMQAALRIRQIVFVEEQQVDPEIEYDEFEDSATHVIASIDGIPVGTARWRISQDAYKLERFAVLASHRGLGIGAALVSFVLRQLEPGRTIYLNSQESALKFYAKLGFTAVGDRFYEANIPHFKMIYTLKK